jgi:hypothetical protein
LAKTMQKKTFFSESFKMDSLERWSPFA